MKNWHFNTDRLREIFSTEEIRKVLDVVLDYKPSKAAKSVAMLWGMLLVMVFTLIFTIRLALAIPLF